MGRDKGGLGGTRGDGAGGRHKTPGGGGCVARRYRPVAP